MYRREDEYRSVGDQLRSVRRAEMRRAYRRRRLAALVTILVGVLIAVTLQTGGGLPNLLPKNAELARGGAPAGGEGSATPAEDRTVLSVERSASEPRAGGNDEGSENGPGGDEQGEPEKGETPEPASGEPLNVLILGVDRRPSEGEGAPSRSDTMMLAQVSPETGRVELLSVPRDLFVEIAPGVEDRINTAYAYGGVEQAKGAMENVTGIPIDAHAIVDFRGFEEIIDAVGGVKVDVGSGQFPEKQHMGEGVQRLGGKKALFFARYRGTAGGDIDRIERQQQLLAALRAKMLQWNTVTKLPSVLKIANDNVDTDLGLMEAVSLGRALVLRGEKGELHSVQLKGYPETLPSGAQVLLPDHEANEQILEGFRE